MLRCTVGVGSGSKAPFLATVQRGRNTPMTGPAGRQRRRIGRGSLYYPPARPAPSAAPSVMSANALATLKLRSEVAPFPRGGVAASPGWSGAVVGDASGYTA